MPNVPKYLLAILPPPNIEDLVHGWKKLLEKEIEWFGSVNSRAHITVDNFDSNNNDFETKLTRVRQFCNNVYPMEICLNHFDSFRPHTFYIAPGRETKITLDNFIRNYHNSVTGKISKVNVHMTIARRLNEKPDQMRLDKAIELFKNIDVDIRFMCDSLVLREFDGKQYNIFIEKFDFRASPPLTLFE